MSISEADLAAIADAIKVWGKTPGNVPEYVEFEVDRVVDAATALVTNYAPDAPGGVIREAIVRLSGWLLETPHASLASQKVGQVGYEYAPGQTGGLRHSGAMSLLSPWKVRRAGIIG